MDADPRKELENIVEAVHPQIIASLQDEQDNSRSSYDCTVDIQRSDNWDSQVAEEHFEKIKYLGKSADSVWYVINERSPRFDYNAFILKSS